MIWDETTVSSDLLTIEDAHEAMERYVVALGYPDLEIAEVMETPAFVEATDEVGEIAYVEEFYEGSRIPLVDRKGKLVGLLDPADLITG